MDDMQLKPLVPVDQRAIAQLFISYARGQGIHCELEAQQGSHWILVDKAEFDRAGALFQEFAVQPYHPKYQQAAWQQSDTDVALPNSAFGGVAKQFLSQAGAFTLVIFGLCWLVYIGAQLGFGRDLYYPLSFFQNLSLDALFSEPWRLIGPAFLHFSLLHIAFNTMWWWQLGSAIEAIFGRWTIINLFLVSAIFSNLSQYLVSGPNFGGLSGVVYAVVGFAWWSGWLMPNKGLSLSKPIVGFLLVWLLLGYVDVLPVNMANTAHLAGLIVGCLSALWLSKTHSKEMFNGQS